MMWVLLFLIFLVEYGLAAAQPIPIIHPNPGGGGGGGSAVVTDNLTITGNGASAGNPLAATGKGITTGIGGTKANTPGSDGIINVKNYGAKGDGSTDDTAAIQNVIATSCATTGQSPNNGYVHPELFFPCGRYTIKAPLILTCQLKIQGADEFCSGLQTIAGGDSFPMLTWVNPSATGSQLYLTGVTLTAPPLVGGSTYSMNWPFNTGALGYFYSLKEAVIGSTFASHVAPLSGLSQFEVDTQLNFAAGGTNGHSFYLTDSAEQYLNSPLWGDGAGAQHDLSIYVVQQTTNSDLHAILNLTGGSVSLTATGALSNAATHHVALTYDGATVRLFVDGVVVASGAGTGTVVQPPGASWSLGDGYNGDLAAGGLKQNWNGQVQCFRVSNTARWTAGFTPPTACPSNDANTLLILGPSNFSNTYFQQVTYVSNGGPGTGTYIFPYWEGLVANPASGSQLSDMTISGGSLGLLLPTSQNNYIRNLSVYSNDIGIKLWNYAYSNHLLNIQPNGNEAGLELINNAQADVSGYLELGAAAFAMALTASAATNAQNVFIQLNSNSVAGVAAVGGSSTFTNLTEDAETGGSPGVGVVAGGGPLQFTSSGISSNGANCTIPAVAVTTATNQVTFTNTALSLCTTSSAPVVSQATAVSTIIFEHSIVNGVPIGQSNTTPPTLTTYSQLTRVDGASASGTVAQLPSNPRVSATFDITDCNSCTFGATCTHSASPPNPICPEKWNGSAWVVY